MYCNIVCLLFYLDTSTSNLLIIDRSHIDIDPIDDSFTEKKNWNYLKKHLNELTMHFQTTAVATHIIR